MWCTVTNPPLPPNHQIPMPNQVAFSFATECLHWLPDIARWVAIHQKNHGILSNLSIVCPHVFNRRYQEWVLFFSVILGPSTDTICSCNDLMADLEEQSEEISQVDHDNIIQRVQNLVDNLHVSVLDKSNGGVLPQMTSSLVRGCWCGQEHCGAATSINGSFSYLQDYWFHTNKDRNCTLTLCIIEIPNLTGEALPHLPLQHILSGGCLWVGPVWLAHFQGWCFALNYFFATI